MKAILPISLLLLAAIAAGAAWFVPVRNRIEGRTKTSGPAETPSSTKPLSSLTPEDKVAAEALLKKVDALETKLDAHQSAMSAAWNALLADVSRENARRAVAGRRIAGVVASSGGKSVEGQVEDLMDETARKRVKSFLGSMMDIQAKFLKTQLGLSGTQQTAVDQVVADILKEEGDKVDSEESQDNFMGWRQDLIKSSQTKLQERLDPILTGEQKSKVQEWWKDQNFGRALRENEDEREKAK